MTQTAAAMDLRAGDVVRIEPHTCHGRPVNCAARNVEVTAVRWAGETHRDVIIDYGPWAVWPGDPPPRAGSVVYDRVTRVPVLWTAA